MDVNYEITEPLKKKKHKKKKVPMQLKAILREFMQSKEDEILRECMRSSKQILRKLLHSKKKEILREFMHLHKKEILLQSKKKQIPKSNKDEFPPELEVLKDMNIADREELREYFFPGNPMKPWDELILSQIFDDLDLPLHQEYDPVRDVTEKLQKFIYDQCRNANYKFKCDIIIGELIESLLFSRPNDYHVSRV
ncbi:uncharacterized protein LOC110690406 [Chenopodium quinoa]|uniref:uncharacterized protein LOC110690406 n=1 Tax=Chenopodium quinoa TaxID=63459 RepID=UPI000B76DC7D|nr:uncharacterized protein LOC110690406 [Chenopodium quinoa]